MITLTNKAVDEVKRIMGEQGLAADAFLRIGVSGGGCSGFSYVMTFDSERADGDILADYDGLKVALSADAQPYVDNTVVDFNDDVNKRGFVFSNPNASGTCGCGSSFAV